MSPLAEHLDDYLRLRRGLGFQLGRHGEVLPHFVAYLEASGATTVTVELAVAWARLPEGIKPITVEFRLSAVRGFARYLHAIDPAHEIPPPGLLAVPRRRPAPYIYTLDQIAEVLRATRRLQPPLRAVTYRTLLGLLAATGMRLGEAFALTRSDVDLVEGMVTVRHAKFDRIRLVPLHPSVTAALGSYVTARDRLCPTTSCDRFFVSVNGRPLRRWAADRVFREISGLIGLRTDTVHPRIHDLRHSFAVHTLIDGHRNGADISALLPVLSTYLGHVKPANTYWYLSAVPELMQLAAGSSRATRRRPVVTALAPALQAFFVDRLIAQRRASSHTIAGYRSTFRLLLGFAAAKTGKTPSALDIADLDAPLITAFLDHLEHHRHNTIRTRNWRLAAIHSLFGYAALHHPEHAATIQRVLAIPTKRHQRSLLTWLTEPEADALVAAPDRGTWAGRRDHAMLVVAVQTGLRISELIALSRRDVTLSAGAHVRCIGKGRKERATPLTGLTVAVLRGWLAEHHGGPSDPLFPTRTGTRLSHDAIERRLAGHLVTARASCPSLRGKHITMHTLRHTAAMRLLHAGIDIAVIALWLGHEQIATTHIYLHADMNQKERAIARVTPPNTTPGRYQPPDPLLAFLDNL